LSETPIRLLLVDDHEVVRQGIRQRLASAPGLEVVAEASNAEDAYRLCGQVGIDIVVMDLSLPGAGGIEAIRRIRTRHRGLRMLVFSIHENPLLAERAIGAGACGFLTKTAPLDELVLAIERIAAGEIYLDTSIAAKLALDTIQGRRSPLEALSPREFEIFQLTAKGHTTVAVATLVHLSPKTVSNHISRLKAKLGVQSLAELARLAMAHGLLDTGRGEPGASGEK
jgi:two-component system, NarL family, invasion response regulator UvrY